MDRTRSLDVRGHHSGSTQSEESALDLERNYCGFPNPPSSSPPLQAFASAGQHSESNAAYFSWPTSSRLNGAAEDRANYFGNLQKGVLPETLDQLPTGKQATTLLELMTIRAFHSQILRRCSLGTAIGFRIRRGELTDIPAILVFVARKVHRQWLNHIQCLPSALEGPGGVWCDVDVVEFSYFGAPAATPKEQYYTELVDGLRGSDLTIGSGSQVFFGILLLPVASQETYGTLGAIVKSRTGNRQVGFLTNRHVAVDLDYPNQKMFHPLPPNLGPGVYLGAVERATSFITDDLWYGTFAGTNPETFVRADGAFIPFAEDFEISNVTTAVKGVGEIGNVKVIDLQSPINSLIGKQVVKVGRSSGLTAGTIMAYALEYNDEKGICFFTDFLVVGENQQTFDLEGDSGSLIILTGQNGEKPQPVGIIWGGTANRGRLKLKVGQPPENWTSGVDLGRLLDLLELDLITTKEGLQVAIQEQTNALATVGDSTVGESSPTERTLSTKGKTKKILEPLRFDLQKIPVEEGAEPSPGLNSSFIDAEFCIEDGVKSAPSVEHQFIPNFMEGSPLHQNDKHGESKSLSSLRNGSDEDLCFSLHLGDRETKRKRSDSTLTTDDEK
ncbi:Narrow leaf [Thalictrum thalictroides]|uniref:Narrow leaf n=1 Tax=Thalictrum thalictroides TaxID=46969 RepID=A0A7J6VXC1_THATH|nr:Narrow leaf [Thalictrum thalictroides]